jgi:hypothetical protein
VCKFKNSKCFKCDKIGHLAKKCKCEKRTSKYSGKSALFVKEDTGFDHEDEEYQQEEHSIYSVFNMETSGKARHYSVDLKLGDKLVKFQLYTGSARTIVNETVFRSLFSEYELKKSSTLLKSYTKEEIPVLGI